MDLEKEKEKLEKYTQVELESFIVNSEIVNETKISLFKTASLLNSILYNVLLKKVGRLPRNSSECVNFLVKHNQISKNLGISFKKLFRFLVFNCEVTIVEDEKEIYGIAKRTIKNVNEILKKGF